MYSPPAPACKGPVDSVTRFSAPIVCVVVRNVWAAVVAATVRACCPAGVSIFFGRDPEGGRKPRWCTGLIFSAFD